MHGDALAAGVQMKAPSLQWMVLDGPKMWRLSAWPYTLQAIEAAVEYEMPKLQKASTHL